MKHSAKAGAAVAAPQAASEVPQVVRRLISKKLLSPALAAAWQNQSDANVLTKIVESQSGRHLVTNRRARYSERPCVAA
jgi:hypothetical protein